MGLRRWHAAETGPRAAQIPFTNARFYGHFAWKCRIMTLYVACVI